MAITPQAGYQVDPNNPNGVIPIASSAMPGSQAAIQQGNSAPPTAIGATNNTNAIQPAPLNVPAGQTPPINTAQPSPNTVNATPYTGNSIVDALNQGGQASDFASRSKLAQQYGIQGYTGTADQNTALLQKYKSGLQTAQQSGSQAPQTQGAGSQMVNDITGGQTQTPQVHPLDTILSQDKGYQQLLKDYSDYQNSQSQKESLTDEYTRLSKDAGLQDLNTQLVNMKNIIDGTQNDIADEITKAGGFATRSQIMALASARNQVLQKNYDQLLQTRDNAVNNINTMIGLSEQDRSYAQQQLNNQLNFDTQIANYQQKFTQNAQDALKSMQSTEGWDGIYKAALASGDPSAIQRINQTMGPGFDLASVAKAAAAAAATAMQTAIQQQALTNAKTQADIANTKANTAKTIQETNAANGVPDPTKAGKPGYNDQGVKYTTSSAADDVKKTIQQQGWTGTRGLLAPNNYNYLKSWWVQQGLTDASFDSVFGGMKDPSLAKSNVYN